VLPVRLEWGERGRVEAEDRNGPVKGSCRVDERLSFAEVTNNKKRKEFFDRRMGEG